VGVSSALSDEWEAQSKLRHVILAYRTCRWIMIIEFVEYANRAVYLTRFHVFIVN
jgi:hypothetical protein